MNEEKETPQEKTEQGLEKETGKPAETMATKNINDGISKQETQGGPNYIEEARRENDRREEILKREEELQTRKEKLAAEEMVAGRGQVVNSEPEKPDPKAYGKSIMQGKIPNGE